MSNNTCLVLRGRVIRTRVHNREYARLSIRGGKELLKHVGREVVVIVIISNNEEGGGE
jgi:hypothetical protein